MKLTRCSIGFLSAYLVITFMTGCGQVITLTPTPTPSPTPTVGLQIVTINLPPTSTPAPYTPEPTPTPTVTPTPVIHTVQTGESLLAIATFYDISVAALQEANGILDPRALQVGQQLIIPRPEEQETTTSATMTPTPLPLEIQNVYIGRTEIGDLWVLGQVYNANPLPVEQARIAVTLLDTNGKTLVAIDTLAALDYIATNEHSPFVLLFPGAPTAFDHYQIAVTHAVPAYLGSYYRDLTVNQLQIQVDPIGATTVSGKIVNHGPEETVQVQVVVTAFDPLDRLIALIKTEPTHTTIPLGGETSFTALLNPIGGPVQRVEAIAQGRRLAPK